MGTVGAVVDERAVVVARRAAELSAASGIALPDDLALWRLAGGRYWYCAIPEHISLISTAWARRVAHDAGLMLTHAENFRYLNRQTAAPDAERQAFRRSVWKARLKMSALTLLSSAAARKRTVYDYGKPWLFDDHVLLAFTHPG